MGFCANGEPAIYELRMALLVFIAVAAATPLRLLKFLATFLRLAALLTVAVNCSSKIFLGLVDTLVAGNLNASDGIRRTGIRLPE
jgi:hypothetical protein